MLAIRLARLQAENSPDKPYDSTIAADDDDVYKLAQPEPVYRLAQPQHDMYADLTATRLPPLPPSPSTPLPPSPSTPLPPSPAPDTPVLPSAQSSSSSLFPEHPTAAQMLALELGSSAVKKPRSVGFALPDMGGEDSKEYMATGGASAPPTRRGTTVVVAPAARSVGFALPDMDEDDSKEYLVSEGAEAASSPSSPPPVPPKGIRRNDKNRGKSMKDMGLPPPAFQRPPSFGDDAPSFVDDEPIRRGLPEAFPPSRKGSVAPEALRSVGFSLPDMDDADSKEYMASDGASVPPVGRRGTGASVVQPNRGKSMRERGLPPPSFERPPSFADDLRNIRESTAFALPGDDDDDCEYLEEVSEAYMFAAAPEVPPTRRGTAALSVGFALPDIDEDESKEYLLSEGAEAASSPSSPPPVPPKGIRRNDKNRGKSMKDMGLPPPAFERPPSFGDDD